MQRAHLLRSAAVRDRRIRHAPDHVHRRDRDRSGGTGGGPHPVLACLEWHGYANGSPVVDLDPRIRPQGNLLTRRLASRFSRAIVVFLALACFDGCLLSDYHVAPDGAMNHGDGSTNENGLLAWWKLD